jgi:hypothetical protein
VWYAKAFFANILQAMTQEWLELIKKEGWELSRDDGTTKVIVEGEAYKLNHPAAIHLKRYRTSENPDVKYKHLVAAHHYCWPKDVKTWHYWTERRFYEHCAGWNYMGWAGGASTTKSYDAAKLALLFWLANPKKRGVIVASTTLESMEARVWGYMTTLLKKLEVPFAYKYYGGKPPKLLYPAEKQADDSGNRIKDTIHGIFAVAARQGEDDSAISTWIGRHPEEALLVILDECTDLNLGITKSFINLDANEKPFQLIGIGNSNSWYDLHGILCTPKDPKKVLDPMKDIKWETTQRNGVALYFGPYESPAIFEKDPTKKKLLSAFLPTEKSIEDKKTQYGEHNESFWRFGLGFWKSKAGDNTIITEELLKLGNAFEKPEWLGLDPLAYVGGLDIAFSTGGDECILQLGLLGQTTDGRIVLDFKGESLQFRIPIVANSKEYAEIQIAKKALEIMRRYGMSLGNLAIDATGQGRAMGGTLLLQDGGGGRGPIKIYNVRHGVQEVNSFEVTVKTPLDLWNTLKSFVEAGSVRGVGQIAAQQLKTRMLVRDEKTGKVKLETKKDYKKRMQGIAPALAHSPDEADAHCLCLQAAIINFGFFEGQVKPIRSLSNHEGSDKYAAWKAQVENRKAAHQQPIVAGIPSATFTGNLYDLVKNRKSW